MEYDLSYGLNSLMEAVKQSPRAEEAGEALFEAFSNRIDEDIIGCLHDDEADPDEDSIESSMGGNGVGDDKKMEELLDKIPPSDDEIEEKLEELTESCLPEL